MEECTLPSATGYRLPAKQPCTVTSTTGYSVPTGYTALYTSFNNWLQNVPTDYRLDSLVQLPQQLVTVHRPATQPYTVAFTTG